MQPPGRVRGQWGKSIWLLAAMSALSNQNQPHPAKPPTKAGKKAPGGDPGAPHPDCGVGASSSGDGPVQPTVLTGMAQSNQQVTNGMGTMIQEEVHGPHHGHDGNGRRRSQCPGPRRKHLLGPRQLREMKEKAERDNRARRAARLSTRRLRN